MTTHPRAVDVHVGARLRQARLEVGLSQTAVAEAMGLTFQQFQKYEKAANRISASRLVDAAKIVGKPVAWFFEGLPQSDYPTAPSPIEQLGMSCGGVALARAFNSIESPFQRRAILALAESLATDTGDVSAAA